MNSGEQHPIILFDGLCNLCERSVQFVIRHDRTSRFRFASLQSEPARRILGEFQYADNELSSVLLVNNGKLFRKSRAALHIARQLDSAWPVFYFLFFWIPPLIADRVYDFVGNRRYRWFGLKEECWVPDVNLQARFLDDSYKTP